MNIDKKGIPPDREIRLLALNETEEEVYMRLITDQAAPAYIEAHPDLSEEAIARGAAELAKTYALEERLLRRLLRLEGNRKKAAPLYDLDYDTQLTEALAILHNEDFKALMLTTKTLKDLQDEATAELVAAGTAEAAAVTP
jgi:carboxyl-terminal processing protease